MKTTRKILYLITGGFLIMLIFTFSNCKDNCPGYPPGGELVYDFHSEDSLKIPYTGHDTLTFLRTKDSIQDTVIFIGQGKKYYKKWLRNENEESDCEYSVWSKGYTIEYKAKNISDLKFEFKHQAKEAEGGEVYITLNGVEIFFIFWKWDWGNGYYDQIQLNGKNYRKVRETQDMYLPDYKVYYNFEFGIIKMETSFEIYDLITK
ncbi:MAG: hypothetical protein LDL38_13965 [Flavobacterium piscis]|nr:hypothetical protein [Flavobacterium piscis]